MVGSVYGTDMCILVGLIVKIIKALTDLSEAKFKILKNTFTTVKNIIKIYLQLTGLIQNEQNTAISKHFTTPVEYFNTTSGTIFSTDV